MPPCRFMIALSHGAEKRDARLRNKGCQRRHDPFGAQQQRRIEHVFDAGKQRAIRAQLQHVGEQAQVPAALTDSADPSRVSERPGFVETDQVHRLRRRIDYLRSGQAQPGSLRAAARELARRGTSVADVRAALATV
jgi:hypothetical protein